MMLSALSTLGKITLLLCTFGNAWVLPRDHGVDTILVVPQQQESNHSILLPRASSDCFPDRNDPDTTNFPSCRALCTVDTCSGLTTGKRGLDHAFELERRLALDNSTALSDLEVNEHGSIEERHLVKRVLTALTQGSIGQYLPHQFDDVNFDTNVGRPTRLVSEGTATVTVQQAFAGQKAFQIGSPGLHGCTIITIVSKRGVHMGHYWEKPSWTSKAQFKKAVLSMLTGTGTPIGDGPPVDVTLYNQPGDDTRVYIMHPRNEHTLTDATASQYPDRVADVRTTLTGLLGAVPILTYNYDAKDYDGDNPPTTGPNVPDVDQRGIVTFQYDPSARKRNVPGWRLLYEHNLLTDLDPTPATGYIPDQ